jgi:hypothetical protein
MGYCSSALICGLLFLSRLTDLLGKIWIADELTRKMDLLAAQNHHHSWTKTNLKHVSR